MISPDEARFCPYVGLQPFTEARRPFFFGRERDQRVIVSNILAVPLTILYGPSGVGKSSVLFAGVVPHLKERNDCAVAVFRDWQEKGFTNQLKKTCIAAVTLSDDADVDMFPSLAFDDLLYQLGETSRKNICVIFDQFEEYFFYHPGGPLSDAFEGEFARAINRDEVDVNFLIALREDSVHKLDRFRARIRNLLGNSLRLEQLDRESAERAITMPLEVYNKRFSTHFSIEAELVKEVLDQTRARPLAVGFASEIDTHENREPAPQGAIERIETPFLQLVMERLWEEEREKSSVLRLITLQRLGGTNEIARTHLERKLEKLELEERAVCVEFFDRLVTPSGTKVACRLDDLIQWAGNLAESVPDILKHLEEGRILRRIEASSGGKDAPPLYEVFHDVLGGAILEWRKQYVQAQEQAEEVKRAAQESAKREQEAARERDVALAAEQRIREVASQANVSLARYSHKAGNKAQALAHSAQALRLNRTNYAAAAYTATLLAQTDWHVLLADLTRSDSEISSVDFSADGKRVVVASYDGTVRLWDVASGTEICKPLKHSKRVTSAQFSPCGQRLVTASYDRTVRLWDAVSGEEIGEPLKHRRRVTSAQFGPDGKRLVTACYDGTARLWDAASGKQIGEPLQHDDVVTSVQFSPDGKKMVTASGADGTARLWDAASGKQIGEPLQHDDVVTFVRFSPDGQRLITVSRKTARLWDAESGKAIHKALQHGKVITCARFSPDGQRVATASLDSTARLWDAESGEAIGEPLGHEYAVFSVRFSPDGQRVVTASGDGTARLFDAVNGKEMGEPMKHQDRVISAEFSPEGQRVVTTSGDGTARVWDTVTGEEIGEPMKHERGVTSARFSPDGQRVITCSEDGLARLWEPAIGEAIGKALQHSDQVASAQFSPDGKRVVTACHDGKARLWDVESRKEVGKPLQHEDVVTSAQFSPDGKLVLTASRDETARLWDAASGNQLGEPLKHPDRLTSAQFSPDGQRVVTACYDCKARLWGVERRKEVGKPLQHENVVTSVQFSKDGQRVVTASRDKTARLWDAASGNQLGEPLKHGGWVGSARFSPDGKLVLTASGADGTARLWDATSCKEIREPLKDRGWVGSAQFSPDGQRVVTTLGQTARIWDTASGKEIGELLKHRGDVHSAQFSPDGLGVVTASADWTARLWNVPATSDKDTAEDVLLLAELAEASGGLSVQRSEQPELLHVLTSEEIREKRKKIAARFSGTAAGLTPLQRFFKWSVSEPRGRTISPFFEVTVGQWIENRISDGILDGLRAAIQVDPANARLAAHFGRRLADYSLEKGTDRAEARRARAEADFQTRRALKLAPENEEVRKLRTKVAQLLGDKPWC